MEMYKNLLFQLKRALPMYWVGMYPTRGVLVKVGVEKVVWTDLVWGEDGRSGVGGGGGTWQTSNWGGRSRQFSYSLLLPALLNAELLVSYIKRVHCTLRNAHYKRVS